MMLKLNDFSLTYDQPILDDINLSFKPGEITVLTGEFRFWKEQSFKTDYRGISLFSAC